MDHDRAGYKRPPAATRFRKGESGNPAGRPPGAKNLRTDLAEELAELTRVSHAGRPVEITKQRAVIKTLVAKSMEGDVRATVALIAVCERLIGDRDSQNDDAADSDRRIVEEYIERQIARRQRGKITARPIAPEGNDDATT